MCLSILVLSCISPILAFSENVTIRPVVTEPRGRKKLDHKTIRKWARPSRNFVNYKYKENTYKRQHRIRN
jgi:hypothetical protein